MRRLWDSGARVIGDIWNPETTYPKPVYRKTSDGSLARKLATTSARLPPPS
jgi:hypothetical protein